MTLKRIGAVVGLSAVLAAVPLTMLATEDGTTGAMPVAAAAPTTLYPGDPGYDDARQWEKNLPSYTPPATATHTVTVTPTTTTKPAPSKSTGGGSGIPWWVWLVGTIAAIGGLLWWGTTLDGGSSARTARDDDDDDDGGDDGQYPTPRNSAEEAVLDRWEEREEARERAGALPRRYPTTTELTEMARLGVQDYDQLPENSVMSYPAITSTPVPEVVPYPEPTSVPVQPAPSGSLMDRLGGK
ncbi:MULTISPECIES: hypothetical protein [Mycobacteriaceae]|uniref:Uncharacterized protein n=2 Tax=Mycobacteroides TaxID=670516 RepID=A0A4R5PE21_9MYCO|nr:MULTISPECIES: hypothetical protein [Mycobacteriaceae]AMT69055.1 hypothetical protein ABG82_00375 [Mycobacteroides immunogenum]ANO02073.1 hypothetical protein BAB75_00375 [Mycobacteroides immunogenum]KIU39843.1 hypothetical protein TL11_14465 [Mycobacteroides immunogenum]KPG10858.1 hypothetical protein AN909_11160 [Mycobacteroides immunogenum]KPG12995.1 hypothetical protein AN910_11855 [Mycobacteroides immunogenum]